MTNLVQWLKRLYIVLFPFFVAYLGRLLLFKLFAGNIDLDPLFDVKLYMDNENRVDLDLELRLAPQDVEIPVIIPELPHPLIADQVRLPELREILSLYLVESPISDHEQIQILSSQAVVEKKVEAALVMDGFNPQALFEKREKIRGFLFYPQGKLLSERTYFDYVKSIDLKGTRNIIPYRRIVRAIHDSDLIL